MNSIANILIDCILHKINLEIIDEIKIKYTYTRGSLKDILLS